MLNTNLSESERKNTSRNRTQIIQKLKEIMIENLSFIKSNENSPELKVDPENYFLPRFCFFIKDSKLVITNYYVPINIRLILKYKPNFFNLIFKIFF